MTQKLTELSVEIGWSKDGGNRSRVAGENKTSKCDFLFCTYNSENSDDVSCFSKMNRRC